MWISTTYLNTPNGFKCTGFFIVNCTESGGWVQIFQKDIFAKVSQSLGEMSVTRYDFVGQLTQSKGSYCYLQHKSVSCSSELNPTLLWGWEEAVLRQWYLKMDREI